MTHTPRRHQAPRRRASLLNGLIVGIGVWTTAASVVLGYVTHWEATIDGLIVGVNSAVLAGLWLCPRFRHRHPWPIIMLGGYGLVAPRLFGYASLHGPRIVLASSGLALIVFGILSIPQVTDSHR